MPHHANSGSFKKGHIPWRKHNNLINCAFCNKELSVSNSRLNSSKNLFCSRSCANKHHGQTARNENHPCWNGGHYMSSDGYKMIKTKNSSELKSKWEAYNKETSEYYMTEELKKICKLD